MSAIRILPSPNTGAGGLFISGSKVCFEVFATAWVAWVFVHMRLLRSSTAAIYVMFSAMIFLGGGILGTFHHLYFSGTPEPVLALGSVFSALEVVPLALIAFDAHDHWRAERHVPWVRRYHLPLMFFMAVAFWNLVGAGVLGFLINPPLSLYYLQGLMTTPIPWTCRVIRRLRYAWNWFVAALPA